MNILLTQQLPRPHYFIELQWYLSKWFTKTTLFSLDVSTAISPAVNTSPTCISDNLEESSCDKWCYCQTEESGIMIGCDNEAFAI